MSTTVDQQYKTSPAIYAAMRLLRRLCVGPLFRWRFSGFRPQRILAEPVDLHLADPEMAHEFYHGRFALAGRIVQTGSISPFAIEPPTPAWEAALNDFSWLRHLDAARTPLANAHARSLLNDWLEQSGKHVKGPAWYPDVAARRLISWLCHARMLLDGANGSCFMLCVHLFAGVSFNEEGSTGAAYPLVDPTNIAGWRAYFAQSRNIAFAFDRSYRTASPLCPQQRDGTENIG